VNDVVVTFTALTVTQPASDAHAALLAFVTDDAYILYTLSGDAMQPPTPVKVAYVIVSNTTDEELVDNTGGYTGFNARLSTFWPKWYTPLFAL
jgi:hypothetical protein